ncbi:hypothetical protein M1116_01965 [Patescibacteria group bacterium]|nr:hypothetical protein [Patescibacteria group bacterium]
MKQIIINEDEYDELFSKAAKIVQETQKASASLIQRKFNIGYARSARLLDELEHAGLVGPSRGAKPRKILIPKEEEIKVKKIRSKANDTVSANVVAEKYKEKHGNYVRKIAAVIEQTLSSFGITARVAEVNNRPNDIEYCIEIALGTRTADILALENDIALALACPPEFLVIEAPIPGRSLIAIRTPYPNYENIEPTKLLPPPEDKKDEFPDIKRDDFENTWMKIRAYLSFVFYLIARLFNVIANFIYPERKQDIS